MLTTFNKELYEQGLKEEGAREADERIVALEQQNDTLQKQLLEADKKLKNSKAEEKNSAMRLFQNGASYEIVRASILSLSDEEMQEIYEEATEKSYLK